MLPRPSYLLLLYCFVACSWSVQLAAQAGGAKNTPKNSAATIVSLKQKAQAGDAEAQANLGVAYHQGNGVPQDDWTAADWFRKGAEQGNAVAQNGLGHQYQIGRGVPRDLEQAFQWFKKAAKQQYPPAVMNVAVSYYNGDGVPEDIVTSYAWMLLADGLGEKGAHDAVVRTREELGERAGQGEARLAELLESGEEYPKNEAEAAKWHSKAAEDGVHEAPAVPAVAFAERGAKKRSDDALRGTFDKAGGDIVPPKLLAAPKPSYDPKSRSRQLSGTVVVQFKVAQDGSTKDFHVVQSLSPELDQQAIQALERWKFTPASRGGEPIEVMIQTSVNFQFVK